MGWKKVGKLDISDEGLDCAEEYLRSLRDHYSESLGRAPTLEEVLAYLSATLHFRSEEFIQEGSTLQVDRISATTLKRPRKQRLKPGDVVAIPLPDKTYAFAHALPQSCLFDFYRLRSRTIVSIGILEQTSVFRLKTRTSLTEGVSNWRWRVIGNIPIDCSSFVPNDYLLGTKVTCGRAIISGFIEESSELRKATDEELRTLTPLALATAQLTEQELLRVLKDEPLK